MMAKPKPMTVHSLRYSGVSWKSAMEQDNPFTGDELRRSQQEFKLQLAVVQHLDSAFVPNGLRYTHIPNQSSDAKSGYFKKIMGTKAGAADLIIGWPMNGAGYIELKAEAGKVSTPQNKFLSSWAAIGWRTAVCRSVRQVHNTLVGWGLKPAHNTIKEPDIRGEQQKYHDAYDWAKP